MKLRLLFLTCLFLGRLAAQNGADNAPAATKWLQKNSRYAPDVKVFAQVWGIYSMGMKVWDGTSYKPVDDRLNLSLRRTRLAFSGEPYAGLKYNMSLAFDQVGRDVLSSGVGGSNKADPSVVILDAFVQWRIGKTEALNLIAGWFRPQISRESITSGFATNSFEKAMSQNYIRNYLVGTGLGRTPGFNFGGFFTQNKISFNYNLGVFNPLANTTSGITEGNKFSPLLAGRACISIGDPELSKYGISYDINFFNKRKGVTLDLNAARQGETDFFQSSTTYGPGILANWGPLNFDGEWMFMQREGRDSLGYFTAKQGAGHVRLGFNIPSGKFVLEPVVMVMKYKGGSSTSEEAKASQMKLSAGEETTYDAGVNWYLDGKNLKLALHYTWRSGDAGAAGDGSQVNAYFSQSGVGAIRRGNWLGLGLNAIF